MLTHMTSLLMMYKIPPRRQITEGVESKQQESCISLANLSCHSYLRRAERGQEVWEFLSIGRIFLLNHPKTIYLALATRLYKAGATNTPASKVLRAMILTHPISGTKSVVLMEPIAICGRVYRDSGALEHGEMRKFLSPSQCHIVLQGSENPFIELLVRTFWTTPPVIHQCLLCVKTSPCSSIH